MNNIFGNLAAESKNIAIKTGLQMYLQQYVDNILEFSMDTQRKTLHAVVDLKGEDKPTTIDATYALSIDEKAGVMTVRANTISVSREWLNLAAQKAVGRDFKLSGQNAAQLIGLARTLGIS